MKTCVRCERENIDSAAECVQCGAPLAPAAQPDEPQLALQRQASLPPPVRVGYRFVSRRAEERLRRPLASVLRHLGIHPRSLTVVERFMNARLDELKSPPPFTRPGFYWAVLALLASTCTAAFWLGPFSLAWLIMCILLVPASFVSLHLLNNGLPESQPYADWMEEEFWLFWKMRRNSIHPVPEQILRMAEEIQTELPATRLSVCYLYQDAFLCARHPASPGAEEEFFVLEYWGPRVLD